MKKIIDDYQKVVNDNKDGKNICFINFPKTVVLNIG